MGGGGAKGKTARRHGGLENDAPTGRAARRCPDSFGKDRTVDVMSAIDQAMGQDVAMSAEASASKQASNSRPAAGATGHRLRPYRTRAIAAASQQRHSTAKN
uniref:Uncharacterized protein n=1 Tax=Plectus sambesii TaxID=2011161 RepID=A0A914XRS6_9BILA